MVAIGKGAHVVLVREDAKRLFAAADDAEVRKVVADLLNSTKHREADLILECGDHWDPIHRCLTDGTLDAAGGEFPLDHCILGGRQLYRGDDFEAVLVRPDIVPHVATALAKLRRQDFRDRYYALDPADYGRPLAEAELDAVWSTLRQIQQLYEIAADDRCAMLFTVAR